MLKVSESIYDFLVRAYSTAGGQAGGFSFEPREETVTDILLVGLKFDVPGTIIIEKPSAPVEAKEGHDWVWTIQTAFGFHTFRIQSKRLYANGRYEMLKHYSGKIVDANIELQIDKLIDVSRKRRHVPLYALYNPDIADFAQPTVDLGACCRQTLQRHDPSLPNYSPMAVTVFDAHWAKSKLHPVGRSVIPKVPNTLELNKAAMPLECIFGCPAAGSGGGGSKRGGKPVGGSGGGPARPSGRDDGKSDGPGDSGGGEGGPSVGTSESEGAPGLTAHPLSYMRKLAMALRGDVATDEVVGFSREAPEHLSKLLAFESQGAHPEDVGDSPGRASSDHLGDLVRQFSEIEEPIEGVEPPDFYVFNRLE